MAASIIPALLGLFPEVIIIEPLATEDAYGSKTYGASTSVACRYSQRVMMVRADTGEERVSRVQAVLAGDAGVNVRARFTLPARFSPSTSEAGDVTKRQPVAIAIGYASDENGPHHQRVYF